MQLRYKAVGYTQLNHWWKSEIAVPSGAWYLLSTQCTKRELDGEGTLAMPTLTLLYPVDNSTLHNQILSPAGIALSTVVLDAFTSSGWTAYLPGTEHGIIEYENEECLPPDECDNSADQFFPVRLQVTQ